ncbi:DNA primase large subunit [Babesia gibsoni]|uniref:DNA primase large subunit n=1 Tax=Babesia gibsoni TaxID=33632 RepID=A0AAD8PD46_BABGI|nr:DNA primase large subunit [Babesia gibsoni]
MSSLIFNVKKSDTDIYTRCFYKGCRHVVCFYNVPPLAGEMNLRSFQEISAKRLALLQFIDSRFEPRSRKNDGKDIVDDVEAKMEELGFILPSPMFGKEDVEKFLPIAQADVISHFILRLAFANEREKREWFLRNEARLFELRLERLRNIKIRDVEDQSKLEYFLQCQGVEYESIVNPHHYLNPMSKSDQVKQFYELIRFRNDANKIDKIYIAPFYPDAAPLVKTRNVTLKDGLAYVPNTCLHIVCATKFRHQVQSSLKAIDDNVQLSREKPFLDERLAAFLKVLPESYFAVDYSRMSVEMDKDQKLSLANINSVYQLTFPPCMRRIFMYYVKSGHLKHTARQQFWLFLKGCGLTLEENLHLNRNIWHDGNNFEKEHVYNIRHMYGKEGRRNNYPPLSCSTIINSLPPPSAGMVHGCPFKVFDSQNLVNLLRDFNLTEGQIAPIMDLKNTHQYQLACVEYFNQTNPNGSNEGVGIHPNIFYQNSVKAYKDKQQKKEG